MASWPSASACSAQTTACGNEAPRASRADSHAGAASSTRPLDANLVIQRRAFLELARTLAAVEASGVRPAALVVTGDIADGDQMATGIVVAPT